MLNTGADIGPSTGQLLYDFFEEKLKGSTMQDLVLIAISMAAGIGSFVLIMKKFGSECMP